MTIKELQDILNTLTEEEAELVTLIDYEDNEIEKLVFNGYDENFKSLTATIK